MISSAHSCVVPVSGSWHLSRSTKTNGSTMANARPSFCRSLSRAAIAVLKSDHMLGSVEEPGLPVLASNGTFRGFDGLPSFAFAFLSWMSRYTIQLGVVFRDSGIVL